MAFPWRGRIGSVYWLRADGNISTRWSFESLCAPEISPSATCMSGFPALPCAAGRRQPRPLRCTLLSAIDGSSHIRVQDEIFREEHARWSAWLMLASIPRSRPCRGGPNMPRRITSPCQSSVSLIARFLSRGIATGTSCATRRMALICRCSKAPPTSAGRRDSRLLLRGRDGPPKGHPLSGQAFQQITSSRQDLSFVGTPIPRK